MEHSSQEGDVAGQQIGPQQVPDILICTGVICNNEIVDPLMKPDEIVSFVKRIKKLKCLYV